jgi:hypothetical protein
MEPEQVHGKSVSDMNILALMMLKLNMFITMMSPEQEEHGIAIQQHQLHTALVAQEV